MRIKFEIYGSVILAALPALAHAQTAPAQQPPAQQTPAPARPAADKPGEVTVTGTRSDVIAAPDRMSFDVSKDLQVQTGTVADALRSVPGVEVDLSGQVRLRGDPGVTILIDGRPSAMMRGDSRGDVLNSMPAGQIERVEVITNPSAAFSPEGSAGIINLVTKQVKQGTRSATARVNIGTEKRGAISLNGALAKPGMTVTGDLGYRKFTGEAGAVQTRSRLDPVSNSFVASRLEGDQSNVMVGKSARLGIDYDVDKTNRLSSEGNYRDAQIRTARTETFTSQNTAANYRRDSNTEGSNSGWGYRGSWRHTLPGKGHELVTDIEIEQGKMQREIEAFSTGGVVSPYERIRNAVERGDYGVKIDYKHPLKDGRSLNLGYEFDFNSSDFDYAGVRGPTPASAVTVAALTNRFDYDQSIHALYGTYQFELGKLEVQAGLRLEQVDTTIDQITDNVRVDQDYFRAYPTLHLGYGITDKQRLRASYSRRIQRPSAQDLNPYTLYLDPVNLRRGNPYLRPEVTDSFELGWQLRDGGTFYSLTAFYRQSSGGVTDIVTDLGGTFLTTRANLATGRRAGLEALANGKFSKTLSYNASANYIWNEIDLRQAGVPGKRSGSTVLARANLTWQPTANDYFQVNGVYSGRQILPQGYREGNGVLNLGYRRKVDERFSVLLTVQNVLDTARQVVFIDTPTIRDRLVQRGPGQIFFLGLTYNLGAPNQRRREPAFEFDSGAGAGAGS